MHLQNNLSTLMGKHRYTIQCVHELTGLSRNTISGLYNGKATRIDFATIAKLCGLLKCSVDELLILMDDDADNQPNGE